MKRSKATEGQPKKSYDLLAILDALSSKHLVRTLIYVSCLGFFLVLILLPPIAGIFQKSSHLGEIYAMPDLAARANSAIIWSFITAFAVSILDLMAALPLAWFIVRSRSRFINVIDTMADIPFVVPTAALGFSAVLFWGRAGGISSLFGSEMLVSPGFVLVLLLHFAFSYPVIVRVMVGELLGYKEVYEVAAKTLGAQPFTAARTVTLPLLKPALITSFLLSLSRSLSETGATVLAAGTFENGPVFIFYNTGVEGVLVYVSSILILTSAAMFFIIRLLAPKLKLPIRRAFPSFERRISGRTTVKIRDTVTLAVFMFFVIIPSLFVAVPLISALFDGTLNVALASAGPWGAFWHSMVISYSVALAATLINIVTGLPIAILLARKKLENATSILDALVDIPIIVPSIALGVSLSFFWGGLGFMPEFWILTLSHTTITYTYFVKSMSAAIEGISPELEEVASTLGAKPFTIFRRITLPLTKYSVFSGAVLVFTRSVGETGATKAVVGAATEWYTAPVLLVQWIRDPNTPLSQSALSVGFLILTSFLVLLALRLIVRGRR